MRDDYYKKVFREKSKSYRKGMAASISLGWFFAFLGILIDYRMALVALGVFFGNLAILIYEKIFLNRWKHYLKKIEKEIRNNKMR